MELTNTDHKHDEGTDRIIIVYTVSGKK